MNIKAQFEFEDAEEIVKAIYKSIKEEQDAGTDKNRSYVDLALNGTVISVSMYGDDFVRLRAVANTWLRLLKVADEMVHVVKECDTHGF